MKAQLSVALLLLLCCSTFGYYLPGIEPKQYENGQKVPVQVIKLTSVHTQLPYRYYDLPFGTQCRPAKIVDDKEKLGEILRGDRIENSLYEVSNSLLSHHRKILLTLINNQFFLIHMQTRVLIFAQRLLQLTIPLAKYYVLKNMTKTL